MSLYRFRVSVGNGRKRCVVSSKYFVVFPLLADREISIQRKLHGCIKILILSSRHRRRRRTMTGDRTATTRRIRTARLQEWWRRPRLPAISRWGRVYKADAERGRAHRSERTASPALVVTENTTRAQTRKKKKNAPEEIRVSFFRNKKKKIHCNDVENDVLVSGRRGSGPVRIVRSRRTVAGDQRSAVADHR